jgi:hypothetical protein
MGPEDESATGSAHFLLCVSWRGSGAGPASGDGRITVVHLRVPSIAPGVQAFIWALVFAVYIWAFMLGVGVSSAVSGMVGAIAGGAVFLLVRLYGADLARKRRARRAKP